jgi:hypothetical protein
LPPPCALFASGATNEWLSQDASLHVDAAEAMTELEPSGTEQLPQLLSIILFIHGIDRLRRVGHADLVAKTNELLAVGRSTTAGGEI